MNTKNQQLLVKLFPNISLKRIVIKMFFNLNKTTEDKKHVNSSWSKLIMNQDK